MRESFSFRKVYGTPALLALLTLSGLLFALFGDGLWDASSWIILALPLLLLARYLLRRQPSSKQAP